MKRSVSSSALRTRPRRQSRWPRIPSLKTMVSSGEIEHCGHVAVGCSVIGASPLENRDGPCRQSHDASLRHPNVQGSASGEAKHLALFVRYLSHLIAGCAIGSSPEEAVRDG